MIRLETLDQQIGFAPGDPVDGLVTWDLAKAPSGLQVNLLWHTTGRGSRDWALVDRLVIDAPEAADVRSFSFVAPPGPYSVSGRMISIRWAIEAVVRRRRVAARLDIVIGPGRAEVVVPR